MLRYALYAAALLLTLAPAGVCAGVWLAVNPGWGICAGSVCYGALSVWALTADLLPDPPQREVTR